jgi:hypothetical protein
MAMFHYCTPAECHSRVFFVGNSNKQAITVYELRRWLRLKIRIHFFVLRV